MTDFTGMTRSECPAGCSAERCIITERPFCAHPRGSGLQESFKSDPGVIERYAEACKALGIQARREIAQ